MVLGDGPPAGRDGGGGRLALGHRLVGGRLGRDGRWRRLCRTRRPRKSSAFAAIWAGIGALLYFTGALGNTISGVAAAFRGLASDLMATFGAIGDALSAGDIALAAKVLWAMLKMEWQKGVNWLTETWIGFKEIFLGTWTDAVYGLAGIMTSGWALMQQGWNCLVTGMSAAWTIFTDSVVAGWSSASNWVSKRWIDLMELMGQYDPQTAEGAKKILDEDFNRASQQRQRETADETGGHRPILRGSQEGDRSRRGPAL